MISLNAVTLCFAVKNQKRGFISSPALPPSAVRPYPAIIEALSPTQLESGIVIAGLFEGMLQRAFGGGLVGSV